MNSLTFDELPALPARAREGHKGSFGSVLVIGGCAHAPRTMLGGAMLAARAALRAGAGRVIAAVPAPLASEALVILPEATVVYPGHGDDTTIGRERAENPFLT